MGKRQRAGPTLALALVLAALVTSCSRDSSGHTDPTLPAPSTTTSIDVSKVPPTIDVPYVQAVMDTLDKLTGDMVRILVANKAPTAEFYALLQAIYDEPAFSVERSDYGNYAARGLEPLSATPGSPTTVVKRIVDASPNCIVAEVDHDYAPLFKNPAPDDDGGYIQLRSKKPERDESNRNPTAWAIVADIDVKGAHIPENPCK